MATLDWFMLGVLALSAALGLWRGLVYELLSVLAWIAAIILAPWFAPQAAAWLPLQGTSESLRYAAGFVAVFVATAFAGGLLAWLAKKMVSAVGLGPVDRLLGAAFGLVRALVLLLALAVVVGMTALRSTAAWQASVGAGVLQAALKGIKPVVPQDFGKYLP